MITIFQGGTLYICLFHPSICLSWISVSGGRDSDLLEDLHFFFKKPLCFLLRTTVHCSFLIVMLIAVYSRKEMKAASCFPGMVVDPFFISKETGGYNCTNKSLILSIDHSFIEPV